MTLARVELKSCRGDAAATDRHLSKERKPVHISQRLVGTLHVQTIGNDKRGWSTAETEGGSKARRGSSLCPKSKGTP